MTDAAERAAWITLAGVDGVGLAHFGALVGQAGGAGRGPRPRATGRPSTSSPPGGA